MTTPTIKSNAGDQKVYKKQNVMAVIWELESYITVKKALEHVETHEK